MLHGLTTKLELDVMIATELRESVELAFEHKMPAMVVHPDLVQDAVMFRGLRQGRFKIIVPVDWTKGDRRGLQKFQGMSVESLSQDGFEILLTPTSSVNEAKTEMSNISKFLRDFYPSTIECRYVLDASSLEPNIWQAMCDGMQGTPAPQLVRTDRNLRLQQSKTSVQAHTSLIESITARTGAKIKLCGNISTVRIVTSCKAERFGVNRKQLDNIITDIKKKAVTA